MLLSETMVFGGQLSNRTELLASSSGGAFTALSDIFLADGNAVVCSTYNYSTNQQEFTLITTEKERNAARGSKYVQSIPGDIFRFAEEWLNLFQDKYILFVGMGCQAAGFISYATTKGFRDRITVVDIICHGAPSPKVWKEYAAIIERNGKIESLTFKDKRNGWKAPTAVANVNGTEISLNTYVKLFYSNNELRPSCHKCPYTAIQRITDITIGDFWHVEDKNPEKYDDKGVSLFLIHTELGLQLFQRAKSSLIWFESNITDCWQYNLESPTVPATSREEFWEDYYLYGVDYIIKKYGHDSFISKIRRRIKRLF